MITAIASRKVDMRTTSRSKHMPVDDVTKLSRKIKETGALALDMLR